MNGRDNHIELSIIVVSYNASATIGRCLSALRGQSLRDGTEVIVVDSSSDGTAEYVRKQFPEVRLFTFAERKYPGDARNFGISRARSDLIAFVDADCVAEPNWAAEIIEAHRAGHPVIGGTIANGNPESYVGWGYYFGEFIHWMPGTPRQLMEDIPTCSLALKRWAFDQWGPYLEGTYCSDTAFNWKMSRDGQKPLFEPRIRVSHLNVDSLSRFLLHEKQHGMHFASVRASENEMSTVRRLAYTAGSLALPLLLFLRTTVSVFRKKTYRREFLRAAPIIFVGRVAWSYGELTGYLRGARG